MSADRAVIWEKIINLQGLGPLDDLWAVDECECHECDCEPTC